MSKSARIISEVINCTFVKRQTSIFLQPSDDTFTNLNICSRDLTLLSMSAGVSLEMSLDGGFKYPEGWVWATTYEWSKDQKDL